MTLPAAGTPVTVASGDSLWAITEKALGPKATIAQINTGWHQLYDANRSTLGADPSVIRPGQVVRFPTLKV